MEDSPESKKDDSFYCQELPHRVNWFQQVSCALVEVDETMKSHLTGQGDRVNRYTQCRYTYISLTIIMRPYSLRDAIDHSQVDVRPVKFEVSLIVDTTQLGDPGRRS